MAIDFEPANNATGTPDMIGLLSAATEGGSVNVYLGPHTVQSVANGSLLQGFTASATPQDPADNLRMFLGTDVQSVRLRPGLIAIPNINVAGIIGGITRVEFAALSGFGGLPVYIEARVGYSKYKSQAEGIGYDFQVVEGQLSGSQDAWMKADLARLTQMRNLWVRMQEQGTGNVDHILALSLARQIRDLVAQGGSSGYAGEVNRIGSAWAGMMEGWHDVAYTLDRGSGPMQVTQAALASFQWAVASGTTTASMRVSGYTATLSNVTSQGVVGRYNVKPLDVSTAEIHIDTFTNGAIAKIGTEADENIEGNYFSKNVIYGLKGADRTYGGQYDDIMDGGEGDDLLYSFDGNDILRGGAGFDTAVMEGSREEFYVHYESATNRFFVSYSPPGDDYTPRGTDILTGVERISFFTKGTDVLILTGTATSDSATKLVAGTGDDFLFGLAGNDVLDGREGKDYLAGGLGDDTYVVDDTGDTVVEKAGEGTRDTVHSWVNYSLGTELENLTLLGTANIWGEGNARNNTLLGNSGNNFLDGGDGDDVMKGGLGDDRYYVTSAKDAVYETANQGYDAVLSEIDYTLTANVEVLSLYGEKAIQGKGNFLDNVLWAGDADNVLDGGVGADIMYGNGGNDTFIVDNVGDETREADRPDGGYDRVLSRVSYTLASGLEELSLTGGGSISGTGNVSANTLYGNSGGNILDGAGGADLMFGGRGNDTFIVDNAGDVVVEYAGEGTDTVKSYLNHELGGTLENLLLLGSANIMGVGNAGRNVIIGNDGINLLDGGLGSDTLTGGANWDIFYFSTALGPSNVDKITDFTVGMDIFQLYTGVFAVDTSLSTLGAHQFAIGARATSSDHRIIYNSATGALLYDADGTGSAAAVTFATMGRGLALEANYFLLTPVP